MNSTVENHVPDAEQAAEDVLPNLGLYQPLVELAAALIECRRKIQAETDGKYKSDLEKVARNFEHKLEAKSERLIDSSLALGGDEGSLSEVITGDLNAVKRRTQAHWHGAIENVRARLIRLAEDSSRKSPMRRRLERNRWGIGIILAVVVVFCVKWLSTVDVSYPPDAAEGVVQGSAALEKLARYDPSLGEGLNEVGLIRRIVLWPVKPTGEETEYALRFLQSAVDVYDSLNKEDRICNADLVHNPDNGSRRDELAVAMVVIDYVDDASRVNRSESGTRLMTRAFKQRFYCS